MSSEVTDMNVDDHARLINKTEDYVEANLGKRITLGDVAKNINFSEYHFHRLFSKYSRETLKEFVTRIKMERSAVLLAVNLEIRMTEIAFKTSMPSTRATFEWCRCHVM